MADLKKYYFTYGTAETMPFQSGWTEVAAPDEDKACVAFRAFHPDRIEGLLNCAFVYDEDAFINTTMSKTGNFRAFCHEKITIKPDGELRYILYATN